MWVGHLSETHETPFNKCYFKYLKYFLPGESKIILPKNKSHAWHLLFVLTLPINKWQFWTGMNETWTQCSQLSNFSLRH